MPSLLYGWVRHARGACRGPDLEQIGLLAKPVGVLDVGGFWQPLLHLLDTMVDKTILKAQNRGLLLDDPDPGSLLDRLATTTIVRPKWISEELMTDTAAPITRSERITNLDTVRGIATLGILVMNAVSFGLPQPAYFNLNYAGSDTALDWIVGVLGEVFVDPKTMAMFSMLFGAGIVVFADRAAAKVAGRTGSACGATLSCS